MKFIPLLLIIILATFCSTHQQSVARKIPEGLWQNAFDERAFIKIEDDKWIWGYQNDSIVFEEIDSYRILDSLKIDGHFEKGSFLVLEDQNKDSLLYSDFKCEPEVLSMFYMARGNYHEYHLVSKKR